MKFRRDIFAALGIAGMALGLQFASGRVSAVFYAQMGSAGWLGAAAGGICFGVINGVLRARSGHGDLSGIARFLYIMILGAVSCMLLADAAHAGDLTLPVRHAGWIAAGIALLLGGAAALGGGGAVLALGAVYGLCLCAYLALLLCAPEYASPVRYALELRLENSVFAALLFSISHAAVSSCVTGAMVRALRAGPLALGMLSGAFYALLLALSGGVLARHGDLLIRLRAPFAALASGWGRAGFYLCALMIFLGCTASLSAILFAAVSQRKSRFFGKNGC